MRKCQSDGLRRRLRQWSQGGRLRLPALYASTAAVCRTAGRWSWRAAAATTSRAGTAAACRTAETSPAATAAGSRTARTAPATTARASDSVRRPLWTAAASTSPRSPAGRTGPGASLYLLLEGTKKRAALGPRRLTTAAPLPARRAPLPHGRLSHTAGPTTSPPNMASCPPRPTAPAAAATAAARPVRPPPAASGGQPLIRH
jgi:hypothetical protein